MLQIKLTSIMVEDQAKALAFYTDILGFARGDGIDYVYHFRPSGTHAFAGERRAMIALTQFATFSRAKRRCSRNSRRSFFPSSRGTAHDRCRIGELRFGDPLRHGHRTTLVAG
jgi:catechol 2,3-dioxygenase-like lactoylglutathione lyase family enzyme